MRKAYYVPRHFKAEWINTRAICKAYGMDVLTLETENEANCFFRLYKAKEHLFGCYTHIGAMTEDEKFLKWHWVSTGEPINYTIEFPRGEPNGSGLCLAISKKVHKVHTEKFLFDDIQCFGACANKFICEKTEVTESFNLNPMNQTISDLNAMNETILIN